MTLPDTDELWLRAALLSHYEMPWLGVGDDLAESATALFPESTRVLTGDGERHWRLNDSTRRSVTRRFPFGRLRDTWSKITHRPDDDRQWAIDQYIGAAEPVDLHTLGLSRLRAVAWLVRWLGSGQEHIPDSHVLAMRLGLGELLEPLRRLAGDLFVGRERELRRLADGRGDAPVFIHGIGGVGKSALAARHLLLSAPDSLICYLNFDHAALDPARPASLVGAMASQLTAQLDDPRAATLAAECHQHLRAGRPEDAARLVTKLADVVAERRFVVVFDTYEEVQRRDPYVQRVFAELLAEMWVRLPGPSIVLAGRAPAADLSVDHIELTGLEPADAVLLLRRLVPMSASDAQARIGLVGSTSPLVIHLMAGVLRGGARETALQDITLHRGAIEGELYRRLLGHIKDPDLRRIAHPGLALRRVTPELISEVLAKPCGVKVRDAWHAESLFEGLAHEAALVSRAPGVRAVIHRPDVRRMMVGRLAEDDPVAVNQIHRAAVKFYSARTGTADRAEELYHRLMLAQVKSTLDERWDQAALPHLTSSIDELPPASKAYLAAKSDTLAVSEEDIREAETEVRRRLLLRNISGMLAANETHDALSAIERHIAETGDTALSVTEIRVRTLQHLFSYDEALAVASEGRERAARIGATPEFVSFTVYQARLLAQLRRTADAKTGLLDTLEYCRSLPPTQSHLVDRLTVLVCLLQLRRSGLPLGDVLVQELIDEAVGITDRLPPRVLIADRELLRGVAAEAGVRSPRLLGIAVRLFEPAELGLSEAEGRFAGALPDGEVRTPPGDRQVDFVQQVRDVSVIFQVKADSDLHRDDRDDRAGRAAGPHSTLPVSQFTAMSLLESGENVVPWQRDSGEEPAVPYAAGVNALVVGDRTGARRLLTRALALMKDQRPDDEAARVRIRLLVALSHLAAEEERTDEAFALMSQAAEAASVLPRQASSGLMGEIAHQQAILFHRLGRMTDAVSYYDAALRTVEFSHQARVRFNRGLAYLAMHDIRRARDDLTEALELARAGGQNEVAASAVHRLGDIAMLAGDIPAALRWYEQAGCEYAEANSSLVPKLRVDQAKALLAAGVADEAQVLIDEVLPSLRSQGDGHLVAQAELTWASAGLLTQDFGIARRLAASASRRFARRGDQAWAEIANLTKLRAEFEISRDGGAWRRMTVRAGELGDRLQALGLDSEAATARMLGARLAIARGDADAARRMMQRVRRPARHTPIDQTVLYRLTQAEIAVATSDFPRATRQINAGLGELTAARGRMAGLDLLSATAVHGWELGRLAVDLAVERGRPRSLFRWLELTRAQVYRYRHRGADQLPGFEDKLAELRSLSQARPDKDTSKRLAAVRHEVSRLGWQAMPSSGGPLPVAGFAEVAERLGDRALISFVHSRDALGALVVADRRSWFVDCGSMATAAETARQLHADLDALAPDHLPAPLVEVITQSARTRSRALDEQVMAPLARLIGDRGLVIVPTGLLYAVSWGSLPSLRGRPVVVAPSATSWLAAEEARTGAGDRVVLVQGAGLSSYIGEVDKLRALHPEARVLRDSGATVSAVLAGMEGARLAHLAAHGQHEPGNALFSRLELADGALFAHELMWMREPPRRVVLAASELALSNVRPGDEALGFAGVLLASGVATVVAAVNRIGDRSAAATMDELHTALVSGAPMAAALAAAISQDPLRRPFICLGSGGPLYT